MLSLTTPVQLDAAPFSIVPSSRLLSLGSCFADHIAQHLADSLPAGAVLRLPFGAAYDVGSLMGQLWQMIRYQERELPEAAAFFERADGTWGCWLRPTSFAALTIEAAQRAIHEETGRARAHLQQTDFLLLTPSTATGYVLREHGLLVSNCNKQPAALFEARAEAYETLLERFRAVLSALHELCPSLRVLFTLSPYRYAKYGLTRASADKAKLRLLIDTLCQELAYCHYFPAYEIVTDELRDYRFYKPDMLHPSDQAIAYVAQRFVDWSFAEATKGFAQQRQRLLRQLAHRPLHPNPAACQAHEAKQAELRAQLCALDAQVR